MSAQNGWPQYRLLATTRITLDLSANSLLVGVETMLSYINNGTAEPYEWTPVLFEPLSGLVLSDEGA